MPLKWVRKKIKGDGNCFYRSIYNSALETGNLKNIIKCFKLYEKFTTKPTINEDTFITELRDSLVDRIVTKKDYNITLNIYDYLKTLDKTTYNAVLDSFPSWCHRSLKKLPKTIDKFRDKFARHIGKKNTWVSELEVRLFSQILAHYRKGSIKMQIHNTMPNKTEKLDCKTMHLLNEDEVHYNILVCRECPDNKIINPKSGRCVSETGNIGKSLRFF